MLRSDPYLSDNILDNFPLNFDAKICISVLEIKNDFSKSYLDADVAAEVYLVAWAVGAVVVLGVFF